MPDDIRQPASAVATRKQSSFEMELAEYEPQLAAALPGHISIDRFKRTVITALNGNPDLIKSDRRSLFTACVKAAQDGLFPDGREAALVVFKTKNGKTGEWKQLCQYMPMVQGIIKRMRNSGELSAISAYVVFEKDDFSYQLGDDPKIEHKPALLDRGKPIGVYAVAKLTNGEVQREVMSVAEVEKVRAVSRAKDNGPWVGWWEEMARKTVIRRLAKRLPNSSDIDDMLRREDEQYFTGEARPEARVNMPKPERSNFRDPAHGVTDVEEEGGADDAEPFDVTDFVGEATEHDAAESAVAAYRAALDEAEKQMGAAGLTLVWDNNVALMQQLDERGHAELSRELSQEYGKRRAAAAAREAAASEKAAKTAATEGAPDTGTPAAAEEGPAATAAPQSDLLGTADRSALFVPLPKIRAAKSDWQHYADEVERLIAEGHPAKELAAVNADGITSLKTMAPEEHRALTAALGVA